MKTLVLLVTLAVFAPALRAQESAPARAESAQIEPAARDLLARVSARYQEFKSFESLIEWKIGSAGSGLEPRRLRVQMTRDGQFVVGEEFPDKSWHKTICDGKTLVEFRSRHPKTYTRKGVESPVNLGLREQLYATLRSVRAEGPLISLMLSDEFGAQLLTPDFAGLTVREEGRFRVVSLLLRAPKDHSQAGDVGSVKLWIDAQSLALDRAVVSKNGVEVFTETYAQTRFNPEFDPALFRAAAPLNYQLVPYFDEDVTTASNPPQEFATP